MKTQVFIFILLAACLVSLYCWKCQKNTFVNNKHKMDSLTTEIQRQTVYINFVKQENPNVIIRNLGGRYCSIFLFEPFGLDFQLENVRPQQNDDHYLSVPAAYTSINGGIDGLFINKGIVINTGINPKLNGFCIISKDSILICNIKNISKSKINKVITSKGSAFQQTLLINESKLVQCNLFGNTASLRRALIKFGDKVVIGESSRPVTIKEFQESLLTIGAISAIYLDMGSWSEGWVKTHSGETKILGDNRINTAKQTSWLVYRKITRF